jgi:hypothetical protein
MCCDENLLQSREGKGKKGEERERRKKNKLGKKIFFQASLAGGFFLNYGGSQIKDFFFRGTLDGVRVIPRCSGVIQGQKAVTIFND